MAEFYDITVWNEKPWYQTGGTRSKVIVENPSDHKEYYFKTSHKKEKIDYKYEFWSEIIASEVGTLLGFDMLKYDIAFNRGVIGCLSKSMVTEGKNKLTEGISYLTGYDTTYNPNEKSSKKLYTFQLINKTLEFFNVGRFVENIVEIIILDSIIGNGDRHQENWGIITEYNDVVKTVQELANKQEKGFADKLLFSIMAITSKTKRGDVEQVFKKIHLFMPGSFSQIYDSGSCLGRELDEEKVKQMLLDNSMIEAYIRKGVAEIHWEGEKLNHFELIEKLNIEYSHVVSLIINRVKKKFSEDRIRDIVINIDANLPSHLASNKLPENRKELVIKLITLRTEKLIGLLK